MRSTSCRCVAVTEPMDVQKAAYVLPVPREILIAEGLVQPTPEEHVELEREAAISRLREAERKEVMRVARERLAAITDPVARVVLDLHGERFHGRDHHSWSTCDGDDVDGYEGEAPEWPCRTVETIARHYGIELP